MKKTQGGRKNEVVKPKISMGIELTDDDNLNHDVEIVYFEMYGVNFKVHPKEAVFADMLP